MPARAQAIYPAAQFAAIPARVGQAVNVIDAQPVHQALFNQLEYFAVGGIEDPGALNAQTREFVDIKEAAPVDVVGGSAPAGQSVGLTLEQLVQAGKTLGVA